MSTCPTCGKSMVISAYLSPVEIQQGNRFKFVHVECASTQELKELLVSKANKELEFYRDLTALANIPDKLNLQRFEEKYGTYDELVEEVSTRPHLVIAAIVSELKRRLKG